jgi:glutamate synthase domain-containing protein 3
VLDERGDFAAKRCNTAGVDLEPVMDTADIELLQNLIAKHFDYTGSPRAKWILENWSDMLPKFIKVFPHEYKRVLGVPRATQVYVPVPAQTSARQVAHG